MYKSLWEHIIQWPLFGGDTEWVGWKCRRWKVVGRVSWVEWQT